MRSGELDRRITLETPAAAQDTFGEAISTWTPFATVWAKYLPLKGKEQLDAQGVDAQQEARFHIRYRPNVTTLMRFTFDGNVYGIEAVTEIGRREGLELLARAVNV